MQTVPRIAKQEISEMFKQQIEDVMATHPRLSRTEAQILFHILQEQSTQEIAKLYGCSAKNISAHRQRIAKKLGLIPEVKGERVEVSLPTVGEFGAEARKALISTRKTIRARSKNTSGTPDTSHHLRQNVTATTSRSARSAGAHAHQEVAGSGSQRPNSSGRWLLPGVLFQFEERIEAWV